MLLAVLERVDTELLTDNQLQNVASEVARIEGLTIDQLLCRAVRRLGVTVTVELRKAHGI